jgi:hypothetical protein
VIGFQGYWVSKIIFLTSSHYSSAVMATVYELDGRGSIHGKDTRLFFFPEGPNRL